LGSILAQKERWEEAIAAYRRAAELDANYTQPRANLARVLHQIGRLAEAVAVYRQTLRMRPKSEWLRIDLGSVLEKQGELDAAIALYKEAIRLKLDSIPARLSLASALDGRGRTEDAIAACREALNIAPDDPETHCLLGLFLQKRSKLTEARDELRRGHALGSHQPNWTRPSAQWLGRCERLIETEKKIPALRRGEAMQASSEEKIDLANLCMQGRAYYADSARLFRAAFAARPELVKEYRYQATRAAALAGCGKGADAKKMTEEERAAWRKQAVSWLQAELAAWRQRSQSGDEMERGAVKKALRNWRDDAALAGLREAMELNKLPEAERETCRQLWKKVDALLKKISPSNRAALAGQIPFVPSCR
jgi:tetratricopeptide (TPR) repeat protein